MTDPNTEMSALPEPPAGGDESPPALPEPSTRDRLLSGVFLASSDGLALVRLADEALLEANDAFLRLIGRVREEVVGATLSELSLWVGPGRYEEFRRMLDERGRLDVFEADLRTSGGQIRPVLMSGEIIADTTPMLFLRAAEESQRLRTAPHYSELREAEIRYRTLVEQISAITYTSILDESSPAGFRNTYFSPQVTPILGYRPEEWRKDPSLWLRIIHPDDRERVARLNDITNETGEPFRCDYRVFAKDGRVVWLRDEAVLVDSPKAGRRFWQGVMVDITAEKEAHQGLDDAEVRYAALVEALPAVVFVDALDETASTIYTSHYSETMLGYTPEDWQADPDLWFKIIHPDDLERVREAHLRHVASPGRFDEEYRMITRTGEVRWVRDLAVTVHDAEGKPLFAQGFILDLTDSKEAEAALEEALERERRTAHRLREVDELRNTLLHTLSHDLRGPLTAVICTAATLERAGSELSPEETQELLHGMSSRARKMDELLNDLLDFDRLDRGIVEPNRLPHDVSEIVRDVVRDSEIDSDAVEIDADPIVAFVDRPKVERIVENLLANAGRHTPEDTRVHVGVSRQGRGVLISIEDEGPGVPDEFKFSIFEPFCRGPAASSSPGSGIGLSLVARFAELHGGRAWVDDRPGGGASFKVLLPNAAGDPSEAASRATQPSVD